MRSLSPQLYNKIVFVAGDPTMEAYRAPQTLAGFDGLPHSRRKQEGKEREGRETSPK